MERIRAGKMASDTDIEQERETDDPGMGFVCEVLNSRDKQIGEQGT